MKKNVLKILNEYIEGNSKVIEYTKDGKTVSHRVETPITSGDATSIIEQLTQDEIQEQILLNTEYNSILLENLLG